MSDHGRRAEEAPRAALVPAGVQAAIAELCQRGSRAVGQVIGDFDLIETAMREWVKQAGVTRGPPMVAWPC
ncbi:hypothetical protein [Kribbella kalugense]|uniref:hypothetical protein n=1 Tax=Kribbella kalugense TaxID=2512221 RepID=UPI001064E58B|nr:hypothetical protein [Kribbella kalugense]